MTSLVPRIIAPYSLGTVSPLGGAVRSLRGWRGLARNSPSSGGDEQAGETLSEIPMELLASLRTDHGAGFRSHASWVHHSRSV